MAHVAIVCTATPASAQSAAEILQSAMDRYAASVEIVDNYRVTLEVMGQETSMTMEKEVIEGYPVFVPAEENDRMEWQDPYQTMGKIVDRARLMGTEPVDGESTHKIVVDDVEGLGLVPPEASNEVELTAMTLYLDTDESIIRRMVMDGTMNANGSSQPVSFDVLLQDYRTVQGMSHPFRMTFSGKGMLAAMGGGDEAQAREQLQQLEQQMKSMSPEQREMMEKMLGPQLEQMRKMAQSGEFEMTVVVKNLEVNVQ